VGQISAKSVKELRDKTGAGMMDCKRALADAEGNLEKALELLRERGLAKAGKRGGRATSEGGISIVIAASTAAMVEVGCETDFVARTPDFCELRDSLAQAVADDSSIENAEDLLEASVNGEKVGDILSAAISRMGENIVLKRAKRLDAGEKGVAGGYVHAGANLGVIVTLKTDAAGDAVVALTKDLAMHVAAADPTPLAIDREGVDPTLIESERSIFRNQALQSGKPEQVIDKIVEGRVNKYFSEICLVEQAFVKDPDRSIGDLLRDVASTVGTEIALLDYQRYKLGESEAGEA
jgi:elongation factor Ts